MNTERIDTRQHILDCGHRLVARKGFVGVGLAELLTTAGVPKGSFYHYFASKEGFGSALLEAYFSHYLQRLDGLFQRTDLSGGACLQTYFQRWIETQQGEDAADYCLIVKLAAEVADLSEAMRAIMLSGTEQILGRLADVVARGQADGSIANPAPAAELAQWLYEAWLGASLLAKLRRDDSAFRAVLQRSCEWLQLS
mgnify:CR=1 FL=1